ncbi:MAG: electron transport complex subunit RsxC [Spirochaetota bacterium]
MRKISFPHGVHLPEGKELTERLEIESFPLPGKVLIPLTQHLGKPAEALKKRGDSVEKGEKIAEASGFISAHVHSPVSGKVKKVQQLPLPGGRMSEYIEIEVDPEATNAVQFTEPKLNPETADREQVVQVLKDAGIVGMGGATFPANVKFSPPKGKSLDTLIINGAECEPYLTCDHRTMLEHAAELVAAVRVLQTAFSFDRIIVGIEGNKRDAVQRLQAEFSDTNLPVQVVELKVKYPQGAEKNLIYALTGKTVPKGKLPLEVGAVVANVQTLYAMYEAFFLGKPLIERVVTVTGDGISEPKNLRVPIGTTLEDLYGHCGGLKGEPRKMITGGPMMGVTLPTLNYSVMKGSSGYLLFQDPAVPEEGPCIMCGRCVKVCPMFLVPLRIAALAKAEHFAEAKEYDATACVECGACAYSCPSKIRLVAWIRYAKNFINIRGL